MPVSELEKLNTEELEINFPHLTIKETFDVLSSRKTGLSDEEAAKRAAIYGPNLLPEKKKDSRFKIFVENFKSPLVYALFGAAFFAGILGKTADVLVITIVVFINAFIGYIQEIRAEKDINALKELSYLFPKVLRGGKIQKIDSRSLVPGDIVALEEGDKIPADGRLIEVNNLLINESSLTGESALIEKTDEKLLIKDEDVFKNMVYEGTAVAEGRGKFIVTAIGKETRFGKIALFAQETETETPIQKKMKILSRNIGLAVLLASVLVLVVGVLVHGDILYMTQLSVSLAVSAIPEGLPIAITIILILGAKRMAKRKAIIRNMMAVETLGTTTVIATDKTGTLTHNKLSVEEIFTDKIIVSGEDAFGLSGKFFYSRKIYEGIDLKEILTAGGICNNAEALSDEDGLKIIGEAVDSAILVAAYRIGFRKNRFRRISEIPFSSERKMMAVLAEYSEKVIYTKGAPEEIIERSSKIFKEGKENLLTEEMKQEILYRVSKMSKKGLKVIGVAKRRYIGKGKSLEGHLEKEFTFLGLIGMKDTYRPGVREAIRKCQTAGIKIIMLTGDHLDTALSIAKNLNIFKKGDKAVLAEKIIGNEKDTISNATVYARILPEHKYRIIELLKKEGEIVAMTGDGVNDVPAIRKADIGIAMGEAGTDAAKESADLVLADDNFATIVNAVEEGRTIFENIRKTVLYLISTSLGEVLAVLGSLVLKLPLPITPLQILWINLITDTSATIPMGMEPKEDEHLEKPPRGPKENIISKLMVRRSLLVGVYMATVALLIFKSQFSYGLEYARTTTFLFLSISQWFNAFNCRSEKRSVFRIDSFSNKPLLLGIFLGVLAQLLAMYLPLFKEIFGFANVGLFEWSLAVGASAGLIILIEIDKIFSSFFIIRKRKVL